MKSGVLQTDTERRLSELWPAFRKGKEMPWNDLFARFPEAMSRSADARERHERNGLQFPENRPSTEIDAFFRMLETRASGRVEWPFRMS